ncbi:MAG TPA: MauE/DoxX family redox-associated membrane protein [Pirellulales bacterium]|nr:MauE/DoxX family redox-associated membrane protein [Pirellulales bacterium]
MIRFNVVRMALGFVLLIASAFKAHQLFSDAAGGGALSWTHMPVVAATVVELVLGSFLLFSRCETWTWRVAVALFAVLSVVALHKFLSGERSCSCLGSLDVPPQYTFGFDLIAVGALLLFRPTVSARDPSIQISVSVGVCAIAAACAIGVVQFGSARAAIAYCQGYKLLPESPALWLGELAPEDRVARSFTVKNPTAGDITVVGAKPSCRCFVATRLPIVVPAGATIQLEVGIRPRRESAGRTVVETARLYLDVAGPPVVLTVSGRVVDNPRPYRTSRSTSVGTTGGMQGVADGT